MHRLLFLLLLVGCAAGPSPQRVALDDYIKQNRPLAESGSMKWTVYYDGVYSRALAAGVPAAILNAQITMIDAARDLEAGRIDDAEFKQRRRRVTAELQGIAQADAQREQARRQAAAAIMIANMPKAQGPTYQIVQPTPMPTPDYSQMQQRSGVTAYFTGKQEQVQTVTYQYGWRCEYNYAGRTFTRVFTGTCPSSVQVE